MGEQNPIRTLGDYYKPSHEGYMNTIELPVGNNVLRVLNAEESWALLEDLALYDNESWNDQRDFAMPVKAIALPQDGPSTSDRRLIELENQVQRLMEAHLAPTQPTQVNKVTSSCEICSGPHDTQYCMENPEQAFVKYASSRTDEAEESGIPSSLSKIILVTPTIHHGEVIQTLGVVRFTNRNDEVAYKMPHKIEQYNSLSNLEKEHTKSVYLRNEEDKRRGVEYVMSKILEFYKECLELGPEYLTGIEDEGEVTLRTDAEALELECDVERVALANLKLDVDENKKIQKQLKKANATLTQELTECKSILAETSRTLGEF
ncbi:hypothetical protein Tco_0923878 [Tanacetum coccineum]|uniref:MAK10-like protein n=1 Tax=Tanacetum coccineum TaxID=301880 RepID=A0ABQ5D9B7_9ASTR